jgi:hypothetical protein
MEILDLRHFSSADLRPLLEDEIAMWGRLLSWDYATSAEMILRYMDAKILPGYAAIERGSIFGYSFFVYEQSKGVIGDLSSATEAAIPTVTRSKNNCSPTSSKPCSSRPASIAWRRSCWRIRTGEVSRPFCNRDSAGIRGSS